MSAKARARRSNFLIDVCLFFICLALLLPFSERYPRLERDLK